MPPSKPNRSDRLPNPKLELPPAYRLVRVREAKDAFAHACANAPALGAGALVFAGRFGMAELAVILEPEEPLSAARPAFYAGMTALCDALAAMAPPEKPIAIQWPDAILIDGGLVGGGRLGWPQGAPEDAAPDWLVFGAIIRTSYVSLSETGLYPGATALEEEGFSEAGPERVVEGFARHFLLAVDRWQEGGLSAISGYYLQRLRLEKGVHASLARNGDLVIRKSGKSAGKRELLTALKMPAWLDPATGMPRL
ncbi:MAG TPA: biotin/lipoate--protein ligase family protein [Hyphomicrobiales bacterium]|nr:biotin/lipoate--protein ligase family protein [Hyphomicrobiales bacterium]